MNAPLVVFFMFVGRMGERIIELILARLLMRTNLIEAYMSKQVKRLGYRPLFSPSPTTLWLKCLTRRILFPWRLSGRWSTRN
jgi:hypothetical protein